MADVTHLAVTDERQASLVLTLEQSDSTPTQPSVTGTQCGLSPLEQLPLLRSCARLWVIRLPSILSVLVFGD